MALRYAQMLLPASIWANQPQIPLFDDSPTPHTSHFSFDWDNTTAHSHFVWHECYNDFKCARLQVPMDWLGTSEEVGKTVEIAIVKLEATVPVTDPTYGGPVVLNPGGPGGSGVGQVLDGGHNVRTILSAGPDTPHDTAKHFDIIGFDPRGINNSRPIITCFPNQNEIAAWTIEQQAYGMIGASNISFDNLWARQRAVSEGCSKRTAAEGIAKHVSTAPVARDVIEIFERHGEWRQSEALRLLDTSLHSTTTEDERAKILNRTKYTPDQEMVQYWGFSYGTMLGMTLSALFPDRVKRAVLDGVVDAFDFMRGDWSSNLRDTDLTLVKLAEYCFEAGPKICPLHDRDGPSAITDKIQAGIAQLKNNPISVPGNNTHGPQAVTLNDLKLLLKQIVYRPIKDFPLTAQVFQELSQGKGTTLAAWKVDKRPDLEEVLSAKCKEDGPYSPSCFTSQAFWDAGGAIACTDGLSRVNQSKEEYRAYANDIIAQSGLIGEYWASIQLPCTAWHARAHWRYEGDFKAATAHPILFATTTIDPVTPLANAFLMAPGFKSAGILHQNSEGHCTTTSVSMCTGRALRKYFQTGQLPGSQGQLEGWEGVGALCEPDRLPFDGYVDRQVPPLPKGESDQALWEALVLIGEDWGS